MEDRASQPTQLYKVGYSLTLHLHGTFPQFRRVNTAVFHMELPFQSVFQIVLSNDSLSMKELGH